MAFLATLALLLVVLRVSADTYLQQIPGSNNRLDDRNRDRENANRCFDSQNNNRGGYNVGNLAFYAGSVLHFSWTNQHSCGTKENHCELILQYACDTNIRDGTTHNTIPVNNQDCRNQNCDTDVRFCRHESFNSYQNCLYRKRNFRLFNSNQNLQGTSAIYTRQNPNGDRRGLECPEERDYYPYWQPTIWKDVAIFTNEPSRCTEYKKASQNVQGRYYCEVPAGYMYTQTVVKKNKNGFIPITQEECLNATISYKDPKTNKTEFAKWTFVPAWNLPAPDCVANRPTRQNHLGNTVDGWPNGYNWTVTEDYADFCVFRLRYNISTYDFNGFASDSAITPGVDLNQNATVKNPDADEDPANLDIWTKYGLTRAEVNDSFNPNLNNDQTKLRNSREYVLKNNPRVDIFGSLLPTAVKGYLKLQLAINTAQYGRTFQDRSHRFSIKPLPSGHACKGKTIYNLGVEGKRGNIVQTFPGTEYDFFPNELNIQKGQCIHIQWTGSNNNPDNNAGQGRTASDRHNIVLLRDANYPEDFVETKPASIGHLGNSYPRRLPSSDSDTTAPRFLGLSVNDLRKLAFLTEGARGHLDELDDAGTYYDAGPLVVNAFGIYKYLCTRNNNFSNRGQKAVIVVSETSSTTATAGSSGVEVKNSGNVLLIQEGAVEEATAITFASTPAKSADASISGVASDFVTVSPLDFGLADGKTATLKIKFDDNPLGKANVYRADSMQGDWRRVKSSISGSTATVNTDRGGVYVVKDPNNYGAIFGVVIAILVVGGAVGFYFYRRTKANRAKASAAVTTAQSVKAAPAGGSPHAVSTDGDKGLPSGWQAVTDPHDGATYYVHATKGLSQWEVPTE